MLVGAVGSKDAAIGGRWLRPREANNERTHLVLFVHRTCMVGLAEEVYRLV